MNYFFKPDALAAPFMVPSSVADKHLRLSTETQLKVLLFILRNISSGIDPARTANELGIPESEVHDALLYWAQCGIISCDTPEKPQKEETHEKKAVRKAEKPSRSDVAHRGLEDDKIRLLLREAQMKFGRNLKSNEASTLVWLYDDEGMEISVILLLLQYAVSEDKKNISFIERTAAKWIESGIETVADAEKYIAAEAQKKLSWSVVQSAFGLEKRRPSAKELEYSSLWVGEWGMTPELLRLAYDECVDSKSKFYMPYTAKILEEWHKKGFKTAEDVKKGGQKKSENASKKGGKKYDYAAYDLDLFEKMLNSDD